MRAALSRFDPRSAPNLSPFWGQNRARGRWLLASGLLLAYAWWVVSLPPFSGMATIIILITGGTAMVCGGLRRRPAPRCPPVTGVVPWALLATGAGAWQLAAYLQHPRADHPTLSSLTNTLLDSHPARAVAFVLWLVAAVELARR